MIKNLINVCGAFGSNISKARVIAPLLILATCGVTPSFGQFGGRPGDVVIYMVNSKGSPDIKVVPDTTVNTQTGFEVKNPLDVTPEPFGPDFPSESRRRMHGEPGDVFNAIYQAEGEDSPHQKLLETVKVFVADGTLRLKPLNQPIVDATAGLFVPFPKSIDFGPNEAVNKGLYLMWTPAPFFPATEKAEPNYRSPIVPAEFSSGIDYLLSTGSFVGLLPWLALDKQYPGVGWKQGIDTRLVEQDKNYGTKIQLLRLRAGRTTPTFKVSANTHLWVLSGKVTITPSKGASTVMNQNTYAFVPPDFAISLSNPADLKDIAAK